MVKAVERIRNPGMVLPTVLAKRPAVGAPLVRGVRRHCAALGHSERLASRGEDCP
jgi:hypothetical protein